MHLAISHIFQNMFGTETDDFDHLHLNDVILRRKRATPHKQIKTTDFF